MQRRLKRGLPLSPEALGEVAARFRLLGEPRRLRLLQWLARGEKSVGELAAALETTQANASKHLKLLADAGLVARRPEGTAVFYAIADPAVFELCDLVCARLARRMELKARAFAG